MKSKVLSFSLLFDLGAILYPVIEILFRGYTHVSMGILGGICLVSIRLVDLAVPKLRLPWKAMICAVIITQLEFICGIIVNRHLRLAVWDYSDLPLNLAGQICPLFSFFWFLLSLPVLSFFHWIRKHPEKLSLIFSRLLHLRRRA
jgi:uncharacterized membrane protein